MHGAHAVDGAHGDVGIGGAIQENAIAVIGFIGGDVAFDDGAARGGIVGVGGEKILVGDAQELGDGGRFFGGEKHEAITLAGAALAATVAFEAQAGFAGGVVGGIEPLWGVTRRWIGSG